MRRTVGFSLAEVLIAVGITAVALLGILSALLFGMRSADHSGHITEATNYARQTMELLRTRNEPFLYGSIPPPASSGVNDAPSTRRLLTDPPFNVADFGDAEGTRTSSYKRRIQMEPYLAGTYQSSGAASLMRIQVSVFWFDRKERGVTIYGYHRRP